MQRLRARKSNIWKVDRKTLQNIVEHSGSISDILRAIDVKISSSSFVSLKRRLTEDTIDFNSLSLGKGHNKGRKFSKEKTPLEQILIEGSTFARHWLKKRLLEEGLLQNTCYICGQGPLWNNKTLTLQLDHVNGVSDDHRIENLRILCPHCHSQTNTYAGKNIKRTKKSGST